MQTIVKKQQKIHSLGNCLLFITLLLTSSHCFGFEGQKDIIEQTLLEPRASDNADYVGSTRCADCHMDIYRQWSLTTHARMTRKPEMLGEDEFIPYEELGWPKEDIEWVLGSHYVNRFVVNATDSLIVLPKIWDRYEKDWLDVNDFNWRSRNWINQCAGCHTTGFSAETNSFTEPGIGCEACHGPGKTHVQTNKPEDIVSPRLLSEKRSEMICMSCHTSGVDKTRNYHFPVGYRPGKDLTEYFFGLVPKPGQTFENFYGDETFADRVRQWEHLKDRHFLASGLTCGYCQNFRDFLTEQEYMTHDQYCMTCHADQYDHPPQDPGNNCTACHQPLTDRTGRYSIHDHRFSYQEPPGPPRVFKKPSPSSY